MAKKIVLCAAVLAMVCGFSAFTIAGGSGPESVTFDTPKKGKTTVNFQHHVHQGKFECAECHHSKNADGTQGAYVAGEEKKCASCHELGSSKDNVHVNCKGCHKAEEKKDPALKAKKISSCKSCHKK